MIENIESGSEIDTNLIDQEFSKFDSYFVKMDEIKKWLSRSVGKITGMVGRDFVAAFRFLQQHFTWVSVIVVGILGCILICLKSWSCKFRYYNWRNWKVAAVIKCLIFLAILCLIKILIGGFFR